MLLRLLARRTRLRWHSRSVLVCQHVCPRGESNKAPVTYIVVEMCFDVALDHAAQCADEIIDLARALHYS